MKGIGDVSLEPQNGKVIPYKRHYTNQHNAHPTLRMSVAIATAAISLLLRKLSVSLLYDRQLNELNRWIRFSKS